MGIPDILVGGVMGDRERLQRIFNPRPELDVGCLLEAEDGQKYKVIKKDEKDYYLKTFTYDEHQRTFRISKENMYAE